MYLEDTCGQLSMCVFYVHQSTYCKQQFLTSDILYS